MEVPDHDDDAGWVEYRAREMAASMLRAEGHLHLAKRVKRGDEIDHPDLCFARLWFQPRFDPGPEFNAAWAEFRARDARGRADYN